MISRIKALEMFVAARTKQQAEHEGAVSLTEAQAAELRYRRQRAEDVLNLTAKFGGDYVKAVADYSQSKWEESRQMSQHRHQPNAEYFTKRENALVEISKVMEGNSVLEEVFADLFEEVAIAAIHRAYSNGRGFYFLSPFIGNVVLNREDIDWGKWPAEQLNLAVEAAIARNAAWEKVVEKIMAYNQEAEVVGGKARGGRSLASDLWATIETKFPVDVVKNVAKLAIPGTPGASNYCTFWWTVHQGNEAAAKILACFYRHLPGIKQELKFYFQGHVDYYPDHAIRAIEFILA